MSARYYRHRAVRIRTASTQREVISADVLMDSSLIKVTPVLVRSHSLSLIYISQTANCRPVCRSKFDFIT